MTARNLVADVALGRRIVRRLALEVARHGVERAGAKVVAAEALLVDVIELAVEALDELEAAERVFFEGVALTLEEP